jgi:phenylalanyl-tRNA synthetase beta chain
LYDFPLPEKKFREIPRFPAIQRDLALVVDKDLSYSQIEGAILNARITAIQKIHPFDLYVGDKLPAGKKGVAISLTYQAFDRTLQEEEINAAQAQIIQLLENQFGAQLRT